MLPDPTLSCAPASPPPPVHAVPTPQPGPAHTWESHRAQPSALRGVGEGGWGGRRVSGLNAAPFAVPDPAALSTGAGCGRRCPHGCSRAGWGGDRRGLGGWEEAANICWKGQSGKVCRAAGRGPDRAGWGGESSAPTPPPPPSQRCSCAGAQRGVGAAGRGWGRGETEARGAGMRFGVKPGSHAHPTCVGSGQGARSGFIAVRDTAPPGMGEELRGGWERAQRSPPPQRRSLPSLPPHPPPPPRRWLEQNGWYGDREARAAWVR